MYFILINALLHWELHSSVEEPNLKRTSPECKRIALLFWTVLANADAEQTISADNQLLLSIQLPTLKDQLESILRDFERANCKANWEQLDRRW